MVRRYRLRGLDIEWIFPASGGPVDEPEDALEFLAAIGHAIASFGRFEHLLDAIIIHINKPADSESIYREHPRTAFGLKIDVLKRWLNQHPPYKAIAERYGSALPDFEKMWVLRNQIAHCYYEAYNSSTRTAAARHIIANRKGELEFRDWAPTVDDVKEITQCANDGYLILNAIAESLFPEGDE